MVKGFAKGVTFDKEHSMMSKGPVTINKIYPEMFYTV